MLQLPSVDDLAARLLTKWKGHSHAPPSVSTASEIGDSPLLAMHPTRRTPALIFFPGLLGMPRYLSDLAAHLGTRREFYAAQYYGIEGQNPQLGRIEDFADAFVQALPADWEEPFLLAGHSFGGYVALEVARRLRGDGRDVALVAMVDTTKLDPGWKPAWDDREFIARLPQLLQRLGATPSLANGAKPRDDVETQLVQMLGSMMRLPDGQTVAIAERIKNIYRTNVQAMMAYDARPISDRVILFRAEEGYPEELFGLEAELHRRRSDLTLGWADVFGNSCQVVQVPGDHITLLKAPHVVVLADAMTQAIDAALRPQV
jgi:thioesterase domain-containing protein